MQTTQQEFKAGDVLKLVYNPDESPLRVMFISESEDPECFHGLVVVAGNTIPYGRFDEGWYLHAYQLAASATPAPSGKLEEAANELLEALQLMLSDFKEIVRDYSTQPVYWIACDAINKATGNDASESALPEKSEAMELPEKWCIERTPGNADMVNAWANEQLSRHSGEAYELNNGFIHSGYRDENLVLPLYDFLQRAGYTLIDDATFKAQVLKQIQ